MNDNIHVAVRLRPLIKREQNDKCKKQWRVEENSIIQVDSSRKSIYKVYDSEKSTFQIYEDMAQPIAESVIQGFNGTIFAYGQTSSGKTYTMMGDKNSPGIIGLTIDELFEIIENTPDRMFLLRVSYLEIYNETISDLISDSKKKGLKIHENMSKVFFNPTEDDSDCSVIIAREGEVYVADLREETVNSPEQILALMRKGEKIRHFGVTNMNEKSSRSHTIFRMIIESRKRDAVTKNPSSDDAVTVSQLNLVDLAGSERSNQTGNTGDRTFINFRGSNLTRILQSSLGGNARTVIICTVTPAEVDQTHSTLKFASRAKTIKNKPQINEVLSDEVLLKRHNKKIANLTIQLEQEKGAKQSKERLLEEKERHNEVLEEQIRKLTEKLVVSSIIPSTRILCDDIYKQKKIRRETWCAPLKKKRMSLAFNLGREYLEQSYSGSSTSSDGQDDNDILPAFSSPFTSIRRSSRSSNFLGMAPDLVESELRFSELMKLHEMSPIPAKPHNARRVRWGGVSSANSDEVYFKKYFKIICLKIIKTTYVLGKIESERLTEENIKLEKEYKEIQEFTRLEVAVKFQEKPDDFNSLSQEIPGLKAHIKILEDSCANFENLYENNKREVEKKSCEIAEMNNKIECMVKVYEEHEEDINKLQTELSNSSKENKAMKINQKEEKDLLERLKNENVELTVKYDCEISRYQSRIDELLSQLQQTYNDISSDKKPDNERTLELEMTVSDLNKKLADEKEENTNQLEALTKMLSRNAKFLTAFREPGPLTFILPSICILEKARFKRDSKLGQLDPTQDAYCAILSELDASWLRRENTPSLGYDVNGRFRVKKSHTFCRVEKQLLKSDAETKCYPDRPRPDCRTRLLLIIKLRIYNPNLESNCNALNERFENLKNENNRLNENTIALEQRLSDVKANVHQTDEENKMMHQLHSKIESLKAKLKTVQAEKKWMILKTNLKLCCLKTNTLFINQMNELEKVKIELEATNSNNSETFMKLNELESLNSNLLEENTTLMKQCAETDKLKTKLKDVEIENNYLSRQREEMCEIKSKFEILSRESDTTLPSLNSKSCYRNMMNYIDYQNKIELLQSSNMSPSDIEWAKENPEDSDLLVSNTKEELKQSEGTISSLEHNVQEKLEEIQNTATELETKCIIGSLTQKNKIYPRLQGNIKWYDDMLERARDNAGNINDEKNQISKELEEYKSKGSESKMLEEANKKVNIYIYIYILYLFLFCLPVFHLLLIIFCVWAGPDLHTGPILVPLPVLRMWPESGTLAGSMWIVEIMQEWYNDMLEIARENATKLYEEKDKKSEISALKSQVKEPRSRNGDKTLKEKIEKLTANNKKLTDGSSSAKMNELNNELAKCKEELMAVSLKNVNLQRETLNTDQTLKNNGIVQNCLVDIYKNKINKLERELLKYKHTSVQNQPSTVMSSEIKTSNKRCIIGSPTRFVFQNACFFSFHSSRDI
ncbi:Centromere-associated protein E [Nymphon striatum]|nr:Centromere-associated protein E [Nymphon striatum]